MRSTRLYMSVQYRQERMLSKIVVGAYGLDKNCVLPKEKLKSVDESLSGPL